MMKTLKGFFLILYVLTVVFNGKAQDVYFSQYYQAPLFLNPALIGMEKNIYAGVNHRTQWKSLGNDPYTTSQFSLIHPLYQSRGRQKIHLGGLGLSFMRDVAGDNGYYKSYGINLAGAYNLKLNATSTQNLSFSIQTGINYKYLSEGDLRWGSQYNNKINNGSLSAPPNYNFKGAKTYPLINTGVLWYYKPEDRFSYYDYTLFAGITANNINRPNESITGMERSSLPILYKFNAGAELPLNRRVHWSPNVLVMRQNNLYQYNAGLYFIYNLMDTPDEYNSLMIQFGSWYRLQDSFIFLGGVTIKSLNVNLSYDLNVSSLRRYTGGRGAFELALSYRLMKERKIMRRSYPF